MENVSEQAGERRGAKRISLRQMIRIRSKGRQWVAFCLDVSVSGIGVWSVEAIPAGHVISAGFHHEDGDFEVEAEVVRCEETQPARLGMRITRIHPQLLSLLQRV